MKNAFVTLTGCSVFLLANTILEALMWATHRRRSVVGSHEGEKDRPLATTGTTAGANGERAAQATV